MSQSNGAVAGEGATSTVKQPLRVTCDLHHKFDQSSHYDHEKDKFAYLSMRDRIELGKRQVQQSQWGSKYALNEDMSMKAKLASMARRIEEFELRNVHTEAQPQAMPTSFEYINHPNLTTQPQPQPSMSTSSLEQAILKDKQSHGGLCRIEKVQDSIEKLTNLDIARGKRKLPPQPHHNLQGTNAKRSRKVLKIDTLVGDCYDNSMDQPSIENHKDANFVWDPGGIQHEVGVYDACKIEVMMKEKEERENSGHCSIATLGHILEHFLSPFYTYYIPFRSSGSQESNASNGVQIGVETKKLWSLQENWTELSGNFAHLNPRCEKFRTVRNTSWHTSAISHTSSPFSHRAKQGAKISHTTIQGAKFIPRCENLSSRCINFAHLNPRCEKFSHRAKPPPGTRVPFRTPQAIFARCETRCEFLSPKYGNFARCNSRCEILILRCENLLLLDTILKHFLELKLYI
ncbi:hypothetical protein CK203_066137 [Vitis vinifera]|uniref:Uncharacterized protein n=1 Tax=Vitis vinifera TaxID=29760 RepID=A0A438G3Q8_VITVI|nr:hypothetical protein CK203_066137 [Vitis vinifera]